MGYSSNNELAIGRGGEGENVKPLPAENGAKEGEAMNVPRRKAPLWKAVEEVEMEDPTPLLTAVTVGGAATPETSKT